MKGTRFSEEQIIKAVKDVEAGRKVQDVSRELGVCIDTVYNWKKKFSGMDVNEARRMRELETENSKLKRIVADLTLDNMALKEIVSKKW